MNFLNNQPKLKVLIKVKKAMKVSIENKYMIIFYVGKLVSLSKTL